jgi:hypothetical protein
VKLRKELWFGFVLMAIIVGTVIVFTPWGHITNGHLGLIMLALIVVAIMLGFPTAFTLMGMGVFFAWLAYRSVNPDLAVQQVLDLMVQRTYGVMSNDVLIAVPLFVFMGYLVERAALIDRLFKSLHLAMSDVPGSLAVATIVTCAVFATATGIVGAVVTLMGLLALPAMLKARYNVSVAAGAITAGGCLGRCLLPRPHARGAIRGLRDRAGEAQTESHAPAARKRAPCRAAGVRATTGGPRTPCGARSRACTRRRRRRGQAHRGGTVADRAAPGARGGRAACYHLSLGDGPGGGGGYRGTDRGRHQFLDV